MTRRFQISPRRLDILPALRLAMTATAVNLGVSRQTLHAIFA